MGSVVEDVLEGGDGGVDVTPSESHLSSVGDEDTKVNSRTSLSSSGKSRKKKNNGGVETPLPTTGSSGGGANNLPNNSTRRIFSSAFKQSVLEAYGSDPECIGNQRATARKFGIHRRQVQKWLTQLEKEESEGTQTLDQNQEGSNNSRSSSSTLGIGSPSSSEKEKTGEEPVLKDSQVDLSSPLSSSPSSQPQVDLCTMSSAAMAMSLNLTHNANPNSQKQLYNDSTSDRKRNNSSPCPTQAQRTPPSIPSPNSLLSRFYSLYSTAGPHSSMPTIPKYSGTNLNGDSPRTTSKLHQSSHHRPTPRHSIATTPLQTPHLQILDEIAAAHPHDDFSLLRQALLRNEVTFTKVSSTTNSSTSIPPRSSPDNNGRDSSRTSSPSSDSPKNALALELLRQQTEYMRFFSQQQSTAPLSFSDLSPEGASRAGAKFPWLSPFAQAAANLALPLMSSGLNGKKKQSTSPHVFVSPKPPSSSKPKTVAAALAASRNSPNSLLSQFAAAGAFESRGQSKKRSTAPRKRGKPRQNPKPSCTITRPSQIEEDYFDPTSVLEVTTAPESGNLAALPNGFGYSSGNGSHFLHSMLRSPENPNETIGNRVESPEDAEVKQYLVQNERKSPPGEGELDSEQVTKAIALEAFTFDPEVAGDCRAVARKFRLNVRVVMKWIKESTAKTNLYENYGLQQPGNGSGENQNSEFDSATREDQTKSNGDIPEDETKRTQYRAPIPIPTSSNKRKTSKPNQICDFPQEDEDDDLGFGDVPLDMMIPIKKRRVSSQD